MPQAIQIETQAGQQGLANFMGKLRPGARAESLRLTEENTVSIQYAASIQPGRKCPSHRSGSLPVRSAGGAVLASGEDEIF